MIKNRLARVTLVGMLLGLPLVSIGQGMRLLGIPLDTILKTTTPRVDRSYITTYYNRLHLYGVSERQDYTLRVVGAGQPLKYKPNLAWMLGAGLDYKWIGAELTFKLPLFGYDIIRKGKTSQFGASVNLNRNKFLLSTQYQSYKGFYLYNPELLQPGWLDRNPVYPYRADLRSQTLLTHVLYQFNPLQLSVPATLLQREGQRKTANSWVLGAFFTYQNIRGDSSLVPAALQADFRPEARLMHIRTMALGVDIGYTKTFVFRNHYFTSISLRPGVSVLLQQTSTVPDVLESQVKLGWEGVASFTVGYSTDKYYGGIYGSTTWINRTFSQELINTRADYIRLVVGKRLRYRPKGIVKKLPGI